MVVAVAMAAIAVFAVVQLPMVDAAGGDIRVINELGDDVTLSECSDFKGNNFPRIHEGRRMELQGLRVAPSELDMPLQVDGLVALFRRGVQCARQGRQSVAFLLRRLRVASAARRILHQRWPSPASLLAVHVWLAVLRNILDSFCK